MRFRCNMKDKKKKQKKWIKWRHRVIQKIAKVLLYPIVRWKYGARIEKCPDKRQRLIIANHQTGFDQFFVGYGFKQPLYYIASEDIFSDGFISSLLRFAVNPIPIKKQTTDVRAVITCMRVAKEGGSIALFPEGNRTFSGTTEFMNPAIAKLAKALKLPLTFFHIEGGYGIQPRWSDVVRRGKMRCYTTKTLEPEQYLAMSDDELYELIKQELYVNENDIHDEYRHKKLAEHLERTIYACPDCGIAHHTSRKNILTCTACGRRTEYKRDKSLVGVDKPLPFPNVKAWYDYQTDLMRNILIDDYIDTPLFGDIVNVSEVILYKKKRRIAENASLVAYGDRLVLNDEIIPYDDLAAVTVLGKNKVNIYRHGGVTQFKGAKSFNAIKYVNLFYHYKNHLKGNTYEPFLGL